MMDCIKKLLTDCRIRFEISEANGSESHGSLRCLSHGSLYISNRIRQRFHSSPRIFSYTSHHYIPWGVWKVVVRKIFGKSCLPSRDSSLGGALCVVGGWAIQFWLIFQYLCVTLSAGRCMAGWCLGKHQFSTPAPDWQLIVFKYLTASPAFSLWTNCICQYFTCEFNVYI